MARAVSSLFALSLCAALVTLYAQTDSSDPPAEPENSSPLVSTTDPSPLLREPKTPEEQFDAVLLLVELARFDLAEIYLKAFVEGAPDDALLQQLRDKHGTAEFLTLSKIPELARFGKPLLERLNTASRKQAEDPAFIAGLITQLTGTPGERERAILELRNAGPRAVPLMLKQLAAAGSAAERDGIVLAFSRMGEPVVAPLLAAVDSQVDFVRLGVIEALSQMGTSQAVPRLLPLAFGPQVDAGTQDAARRALAKVQFGDEDQVQQLSDVAALEQLRAGAERLLIPLTPAERVEQPEQVAVWSWNDAEQALTSVDLPIEEARLREGVRLSRDAFQLGTANEGLQTLYLTALLADEVRSAGWDQLLTAETSPAMQTAVATGTGPLQRILARALDQGRTDAAWGALQGLSALAGKELIQSRPTNPAPVLRALNYPDPRVQFAAAMVALRSDPHTPFAGAARVTQILRSALKGPGVPRAVVINGDVEELGLLGNYAADEGYEPLLARTGKAGFQQAAEQFGVGLVIVQTNVGDWPLTQTLANLRADARTAYLPIIVYGPEEVRTKTDRLIARTGQALFVGEAPAAESFWETARPFLAGRATPLISDGLRADFQAIATYWLAELADDTTGVFDVTTAEDDLVALLDDPQLAPNALTGLGRIGTVTAQTRLAEVVLNESKPIELRRGAASQLVGHLQRFGVVLPGEQIPRLTGLWETTADAELQGLLAAVMGSLKPNAGLVGERLQRVKP